MRRIALLVVCLALLGAAACSSEERDGAPDGVITVTPDDNGEGVRLSVGDTLRVALPANPSTGYEWGEAEVPDELERTADASFARDSSAAGSPGVVTLEYSGVHRGRGTLELWYARPWESVQPMAKFTLDITVE